MDDSLDGIIGKKFYVFTLVTDAEVGAAVLRIRYKTTALRLDRKHARVERNRSHVFYW